MGARRFSLEDQERGLAALIITGNSSRAEELSGIDAATLRAWKTRDPARYERLRTELNPKVAERLASDAEELTQRYQEAQRETLDRYMDKIDEMDAKDLAGAQRNLATAAALNVDKISSPLRERPSHVQQGKSLDQVVQAMARLVGFDASAVATEITDAVEIPSRSEQSVTS